MKESVAKLFAGIIDYAGMFPPARHGLAEALAEYDSIKSGSYSWLVSRFVCAAENLDDLAAAAQSRPLKLAVIGSPSADWAEFECNWESDASRLSSLPATLAVEAYETKVPARFEEFPRWRLPTPSNSVFLEIPIIGNAPAATHAALQWVGTIAGASAKVRTGGASATSIPSTREVADFIRQALDLGLSFKATAGLHQPLRHFDSQVGASMHGFLNLFVAAVLAITHDLQADAIEEVLSSADANDFVFLDGALRFGDWEAGLRQIEKGREFAVSFGSCSVEEPVEALKALGILS